MDPRMNALGQPIGWPLPDWTPRPLPPRSPIAGRFCRVEPLDPVRHADALFDANAEDGEARNWTYLAYGPFGDRDSYRRWLEEMATREDPLFHAVVDAGTGRAVGVASYLRIDRNAGVIEVGHLNFSPRLQRRPAATEAMALMMRRAFDELGYRRYEWKCDVLNAPSLAAAKRLGFTYEGTFRQATVTKQRNRDTAWFSILDREWPTIRGAFDGWLDAGNFDAEGRQRRPLSAFMAVANTATAGE